MKEVLGAGGTAVVYRAEAVDGRAFAIKVLHDHLSRNGLVCRRFVREGQVGNVLDHPGTVRVLDHGTTEEGCPYLVLELLEGESLEERRVRVGGRLGLDETLDFCDQLLAVLEVAHARSIVHRDIKPSNLFVTTQGRLKVLDFGIARLVDDTSTTATKTGQMVGTPAFMPPEQALSRPRDVDARTDLWSVGATLFTLLSGEHVHIAESSSEHLVKAATMHARSVAAALPGVPSNVEALIARCLAFDKDERWPSATAMRAALWDVRADPGQSMVGVHAPERRSDSNVPTVIADVVSTPPRVHRSTERRSSPPVRGVQKSGEVDANMSLTSTTALVLSRRRRWLVPFAVASSALLALMSVVVLTFAVRTTSPSRAAVAATKVVGAHGESDRTPPVASLSGVTPVVIEEPASSTPAAPLDAPVEQPAPPAPAPVKTGPGKPKKPTPTSRRDLYRPF